MTEPSLTGTFNSTEPEWRGIAGDVFVDAKSVITPGTHLVDTQIMWERMWEKAHGFAADAPPAPTLPPGKVGICIFCGITDYETQITIKEISKSNQQLVIHYHETYTPADRGKTPVSYYLTFADKKDINGAWFKNPGAVYNTASKNAPKGP